MGKCIVVGAGECDTDDMAKRLVVGEDDLCIAADGGIDYLKDISVIPHLVIGDMDSISCEDNIENYETIVFPTQKDDSDMLLAIKEGLKRGYREFDIYAALGGRFDHTFANIQCLAYLAGVGARARLYGNNGSFITMIMNGEITFLAQDFKQNQKISVFAYGSKACGVTIMGLKYNLVDATITTDYPIGLSNEFTTNDAYIKVNNGILMICVD